MNENAKTRTTTLVRVYISSGLLDHLALIGSLYQVSLSRLVNSAIAIAIRNHKDLVTGAKDAEQSCAATRS